MSELSFPLVGIALVYFLFVPLLSLMSWGALRALPASLPQAHFLRLTLLVLPSFAPILWILSSLIHQAELGTFSRCINAHLEASSCFDLWLFSTLLLVGPAIRLFQLRKQTSLCKSCPQLKSAKEKLAGIIRQDASLVRFEKRISICSNQAPPASVQGWFFPRIVLQEDYLASLDESELRAVLLHEVAHLHSFDGARYLLAHWAIQLNPWARLLRPQLQRYELAREIACDAYALRAGACPLSLSEALVLAATFERTRRGRGLRSSHSRFSPAATGPLPAMETRQSDRMLGLSARVQLLLLGTPQAPARKSVLADFLSVLGMLLLLAVVLGPHFFGTDLLNQFHLQIEAWVAQPLFQRF